MTRQPKDFSKGKIYCIRNNINDEIYIGSTCQSLSQRMVEHRASRKQPKQQTRKLVIFMNEVDDNNVFYPELIEDYPCENFYQLRKREGELIREMKPTLNLRVECRTKKEYYEVNKEHILDKCKEYHENNREHLNQQRRERYETNKDREKEQQQAYRENNREVINEKQRERYEQNKEERNRKHREHYHANKERISERRKELKAMKKQMKEN